MPLIAVLLRGFFYLLYHPFAWTYDLVAALVSLGNWKDWVGCSLPYLDGRILEIGFGPGHLQESLLEQGFPVFGLDESRQMARQAGRRLRRKGYAFRLARGYAQKLPYTKNAFDTVVVTFPSEYIFDPQTLTEIRRILTDGGKLVLVPSAWITGTRPLERLAAWLFRVTGQAPRRVGKIPAVIQDRFRRAGFLARSELIELKNSRVLVVIATRTSIP